MPRQSKTTAASGKDALPHLSQQMLEELIPGPVTKEQFTDIFENFKKAFIECAMGAEMSHHLGYGPGQNKPEGLTNHRNGTSDKTVFTDSGAVRIEVPRDRAGSFEPQLIGKHERRFAGFDDKIRLRTSMAKSARGSMALGVVLFVCGMPGTVPGLLSHF